MEVYFIRHGIAADRADYPQDEDRPLTERGREKTKQVARRLREIGISFDLILTSPLLRATQTAAILQKTGLSQEVEEFSPLAPHGDFQTWENWLCQWCYNRKRSYLALVGHQPDLANWAEILLWGEIQGKLVLKKAGAMALELPREGTIVGKSQLFLLTSPKWLIT